MFTVHQETKRFSLYSVKEAIERLYTDTRGPSIVSPKSNHRIHQMGSFFSVHPN